MRSCILAFGLLISCALEAGQIAETSTISIWHEEFGQAEQPALLLNMGGCCQGILWHQQLCEKLAESGFYVIRYDYRDAGLSTCVNFEQAPYNLDDLVDDAFALLDHLEIDAAHVAGLSMGGAISQLMAVKQPERVLSLTLISTSPDFEPFCRSLEGLEGDPAGLPGGDADYLATVTEFIEDAPEDETSMLELRLKAWRSLNGADQPFDEALQHELQQSFLDRCAHPESVVNHVAAQMLSLEAIRQAPAQITQPTVVLHGTADPVFPLPHGIALADRIEGALLTIAPNLGHVPRLSFDELYVEAIKRASGIDLQTADTAAAWCDALELRLDTFERDSQQLDPVRCVVQFSRLLHSLGLDLRPFDVSSEDLPRVQRVMLRIEREARNLVAPIEQANQELLGFLAIEV